MQILRKSCSCQPLKPFTNAKTVTESWNWKALTLKRTCQKKKVRVKRLARIKSKPEVGAYKVPHLFICFVRLNKLIMITMITSSWSKKYNSFPISSLNNDDNYYFLVYLFIVLGGSSMRGWSDQIVTSELQFSWQIWQKSCETVWSHNYAPI